jgi:hypothetical protein
MSELQARFNKIAKPQVVALSEGTKFSVTMVAVVDFRATLYEQKHVIRRSKKMKALFNIKPRTPRRRSSKRSEGRTRR